MAEPVNSTMRVRPAPGCFLDFQKPAAQGNAVKYASLVDRGFDTFIATYNRPGFDFNVNAARLFVCTFLTWKLFSRDYGFFGTIPEDVFYLYPFELYDLDKWVWWTGLPVIQDLLTFHWLHWFLPHPGVTVLRVIQGCAMVSVIMLAVFGRGPRRSILIATYSLLVYLWGYIFLLGQEIDSIDLYFGLLIAIGLGNYADVPIWRIPSLYSKPRTAEGGRSYSNLLLVFVFYYFASGMKKLTDMSPIEWFRFDLIEEIENHTIRAEHSTLATLSVFQYLHGLTFLDYIGPPAVYLSHLLVPMVFFRRRSIFKFFLFYLVFHLLTFGVGISFSGYIFVWSVLFPYREMIDWARNRAGVSASRAAGAGDLR